MSMISSTKWVPRGYASEFPRKYELDESEIDRISELARIRLEDAKSDIQDSNSHADESVAEEIDEDLKEYDLEHYDDDEDDAVGVFGTSSLTYHEPEDKDPYITLPTAEDQEEEREEWQILPSDNLILAARTEDEVSYLEVYVYDDGLDGEDPNLYVHHDIMLPSYPLCVEWFGTKASSDDTIDTNFAAIGTFEPEIEIWNLDVVDGVYPDIILGQRPEGKKKSKKINKDRHIDAVLSLSSNPFHRNLLASGSADTTVKLWDISNGSCANNLQFRENSKVSSVQWNPVDSTVLLVGGYDKLGAIVCDVRASPGTSEAFRQFKVKGDIEGVRWGNDGKGFYVSTDRGTIHKFDARAGGSASIWTIQAHDSEISSFDINNNVPGLMVTGSVDNTIKLWNIDNEKGPTMLLSRDLDIGKVFSVGFAPDKEVQGHLVVAGSKGKVKVWDTLGNKTVRRAFNFGGSGKSIDKVVELSQEKDEDEDEDDE